MKKKCLILFCFALSLFSCELDKELSVCAYNVQLEYWYAENESKNDLNLYVRTIDEYIFDASGVLYMVNRIDIESCNRRFVSEITLPPGDYEVVGWGNIGDVSRVNPVEVGVTSIQEIRMIIDKQMQDDSYAHSEDLYNGFRTFSVADKGVSRARVVMTHTHLLLDITVRWKSRAPTNTNDFYMTLGGVHDRYDFIPDYVVNNNMISGFSPVDEPFEVKDKTHRYYLVNHSVKSGATTHRQDVTMDITRSINGRFRTYRISNDSHPVLQLYNGKGPLMKEIDLNKYFRTMSIELDMNLKQVFYLLIEIDGDTVMVMPLTFSDWINGGEIGNPMK